MSQHDPTNDATNDPTRDATGSASETTSSTTEPIRAMNETSTRGGTAATDETTTIETLLHESDADQGQREDSPRPATAPASEPVPAATYGPAAPSPAQPEFKTGPAPITSVIGLLGLLTAIAVLLTQATDLDIHWGVAGPVVVVGAGVLLVVLGLAGLRGQRFRG